MAALKALANREQANSPVTTGIHVPTTAAKKAQAAYSLLMQIPALTATRAQRTIAAKKGAVRGKLRLIALMMATPARIALVIHR